MKKYFSFSSPIYFNSGLKFNNLSSCSLISIEEDSIDEIFNIMKKIALLSKNGSGISLYVSYIREKG